MFKRRREDPQKRQLLDSFLEVGSHVESAQRALLQAVPTFRDDGVQLGIALAQMGSELDDAEAALSSWEAPDELVQRCRSALATARAEAEKLRLEPNELVFEALNARIGDILFALETFVDVETELREDLRS